MPSETAHVYDFRPVEPADLARLGAWLAEPHVARWWSDPATGIAYDMFAPLAGNLFRGFAEEVAAEFGPRVKLFVEHAKGQLGIGDIAVVVAAGTPHRDEAFRACRALIEAVKHRAPIWKQEHYVDGSSEWSEGCSLCDTSRAAEAAEAHAHDHAHDHAHEPGHRHV